MRFIWSIDGHRDAGRGREPDHGPTRATCGREPRARRHIWSGDGPRREPKLSKRKYLFVRGGNARTKSADIGESPVNAAGTDPTNFDVLSNAYQCD